MIDCDNYCPWTEKPFGPNDYNCAQCFKQQLRAAEARVCKLSKENTLLLWEKDIDDQYQKIRKLKEENDRLVIALNMNGCPHEEGYSSWQDTDKCKAAEFDGEICLECWREALK